MLYNGEITTRLAKYGLGIRSPKLAGNTGKRFLPKKEGAMKTNIENLFELSPSKTLLAWPCDLLTRLDFS